jgi:hypothetical protein
MEITIDQHAQFTDLQHSKEEDWKIIETNKNKLKIIVLDTRTKSKNTIPQLKN